MREYKTVQVGPLQIKYLHKGSSGEPLVFSHGFGIPPKHYEPLLDGLAKDHEVISPLAYGFKPQPTSVDEYAELTSDFANKLHLDGAHFVGHSTGGSVAIVSGSQNDDISNIVAINPLLPVNYGVWGVGLRAIYKGYREIVGIDGEESSTKFGLAIPVPFMINMIKDLGSSYELIRNIYDFHYKEIKTNQPVLILYGEDDEFFKLDEKNESLLNQVAHNIQVKRFPERNHDWPIFWPNQASDEVNQFITQLRKSQ